MNLVRATQVKVIDVLSVKRAEYNTTDDRLDQFKKVAKFRGQHPMEVLAGFMVKHTSSVYDCIDRTINGEEVSVEMWEEKIIDHINYLHLLMALALDEEME
jgi:hypothetical protein